MFLIHENRIIVAGEYLRKFLLILLPLLFSFHARAQNTELDSLIKKAEQAKERSELFTAQKNLATYYSYSGDIEAYGAICQQMLRSAREANNDTFLLIAYGHLANYFSNKSEFQSSLDYNLKALLVAEQLENPEKVCRFYNNIADCYRSLKNYRKSLEYLQKAEKLLPVAALKTPVLPRYVFINFCETYLGLNNTDSALRYVQLANEQFNKNKNDQEYIIVLYDFALVYAKKGENEIAESYFKRSVALADSVKEPYNLAEAAKNYSLFLFKLNRYEEAIPYAMKSFTAATESGNKLGLINAASILHQVFLRTGKSDSAYKYLAVKDAYRDSVFNEEHLNKIQEITFKEQLRENEKEAELLKEKAARQKNIEYGGIAVGILVLIISFLVISNTVMVNARVIKFLGLILLLIVFEFIIIIIHPWLGKITHHQPVLVLLANVIIAGILIMPHHYLEHMINHRLVEKNKKIRVKTAKKILASVGEGEDENKSEPLDKNNPY